MPRLLKLRRGNTNTPTPLFVKVGTKVQLKITAIDHDHGFKIGSVPDGGSSSGKGGLIFTSEQECWQLRRGKRP
jgi:hypothetical protein